MSMAGPGGGPPAGPILFTWLMSSTWFPSVMSRPYCLKTNRKSVNTCFNIQLENTILNQSCCTLLDMYKCFNYINTHQCLCWVYDTYSLVVALEGNICVSPLECVIGSMIPCNVVNPVGFVVVPMK